MAERSRIGRLSGESWNGSGEVLVGRDPVRDYLRRFPRERRRRAAHATLALWGRCLRGGVGMLGRASSGSAEPPLTDDTGRLVRVNGAVQVGAGIGLALGIAPRLAALALAASLVPTTAAGHRFWEEEDDKARAQQTIHFLKNITIMGGLLEVCAAGAGAVSLDHALSGNGAAAMPFWQKPARPI